MSLLRWTIPFTFFLLLTAMILTACDYRGQSATILPRPDHVVIVIYENKEFSQIIGNGDAPYINSLAGQGALFTRSFAISHPSQPDYLALFSGDMQGIADDSCPHAFTTENLGSRLFRAGLTFGSFSESMPTTGFTGCEYGLYVRKHNPGANWQGVNIPVSANMPFTSFPCDFRLLPTVSLVIPNMKNDMHDGTIHGGDSWLRKKMDAYVRWARTNNSLLIVTFDEDSGKGNNRITTIFVGPMVKPGVYPQRIDHYAVLRTILEFYGLAPLGNSATAAPITAVWVR